MGPNNPEGSRCLNWWIGSLPWKWGNHLSSVASILCQKNVNASVGRIPLLPQVQWLFFWEVVGHAKKLLKTHEDIMFEKVIRSHPTCPEALIIAQDQTRNLPTHLDRMLKKIPHFLQKDTLCSFMFEESPRNWPHFWWYDSIVYFIQRYNTVLFRYLQSAYKRWS